MGWTSYCASGEHDGCPDSARDCGACDCPCHMAQDVARGHEYRLDLSGVQTRLGVFDSPTSVGLSHGSPKPDTGLLVWQRADDTDRVLRPVCQAWAAAEGLRFARFGVEAPKTIRATRAATEYRLDFGRGNDKIECVSFVAAISSTADRGRGVKIVGSIGGPASILTVERLTPRHGGRDLLFAHVSALRGYGLGVQDRAVPGLFEGGPVEQGAVVA